MTDWTTPPKTFSAGATLTAADLNTYVRDAFLSLFPVGFIGYMVKSATTVETLINQVWLECNGVAVSRTTYADLNTLMSGLSYPFGSGNGTTTFNLPDLQGRSLVSMAASGHTDVNGLGDSDGYAKATRSPKHNHTDTLTLSGGDTFISSISSANVMASGSEAVPFSAGTDPESQFLIGSVGPGGTRPDDTTPYQVAGITIIKAFA